MRRWKPGHVAAGLATIYACFLAGACGGGGDDQIAATATEPDTVVFNMTGLLLVVPPKSGGFALNVLMPYLDDHAAKLGVGVAKVDSARNTSLCNDKSFPNSPSKQGICYIDLSVCSWSHTDRNACAARTQASRGAA